MAKGCLGRSALHQSVQRRSAREKGKRTKLAKTAGALAIAVGFGREDGDERHSGGAGGERIVNIVADVQGRRGITLAENEQETIRMRLFALYVVLGNDRAKP